MKNNIKNPLNSIYDIDKKILPFFSSPVILKRISDQKKNRDWSNFNPQKKLIYKIIKLNEKLVEFTTWINKYKLNLDSFFINKGDGIGNKLTGTEFILSVPKGGNNLYYNLKFRLSNILYKIEKFIPVFKFHSLLNNINLFAPKRLLKPQPYIRFTHRIIQINNNFKSSSNNSSPANPISAGQSLQFKSSEAMLGESSNNLFTNYNSILPGDSSSPLLRTLNSGAIGTEQETRKKVLIKINNYNLQSSFDSSLIQLYKLENGRSIKYILLKLNNLLNEIDNIINIKNKLIKIIKITRLADTEQTNLDIQVPKIGECGAESQSYPSSKSEATAAAASFLKGEQQPERGTAGEVEWLKEQSSNQSVKNLRLKIKKINSYNNNNIDISPFLVEETRNAEGGASVAAHPSKSGAERFADQGLVKENIIKIEKNIKSIQATPTSLKEKDIINENSNPVDLLYFNNNLKKPVINHYLKSMSTYNMITNGTILYYSNIIGFNFKKRIREYLPFIKSVPVLSLQQNSLLRTNLQSFGAEQEKEAMLSSTTLSGWEERLTSPYSLRGLRKVVGSLDKGKFSVFGRGIENNKLINNIYKFLYLSFKSMYCLISKPVFIIKSNKITIQLFYFLLIPKIFKHIKSKSNYKYRNKKKIAQEFIDRRIIRTLANLFESRLKVKEDALKIKYFVTLPSQIIKLRNAEQLHNPSEAKQSAGINPSGFAFGAEQEQSFKGDQVNSSNNLIMNLDLKSAKFLMKSYKNELLKIRAIEGKNNGVKFDKFGRLIFKSLENKLIQNGVITNNGSATRRAFLPELWAEQEKFIKINKNNKNIIKKRWRLHKLFFKRFNNMNNNLHILRIPRKWTPYFAKMNFKVRKGILLQNRSGGRLNIKLFKYLALTYLNIFKFKVSHPMLNRLKFKLKWFKKELINDNKYLLSYNKEHDQYLPLGQGPQLTGAERGTGHKRRNKFNSYNQINWFLFKKLFWSINLSKKIIPNAKILHKWGIPQWSWPYSGIKKKGYTPQATRLLTKSILYYSWPFSLLMSPTIFNININKKVDHFNFNLNSKLGEESLSLNRTQDINLYDNQPISSVESKKAEHLLGLTHDARPIPKGQRPESRVTRYKIRELYTRRHHLMKLANINLIKIYPLKFEKLCEVLNSIFNKPVELDLIRLHYPYLDSNILVRLLAFMINKLKLIRITRRLFNKAVVKSIKKIDNKDHVNIIPAFLSGLTIKVAGRLMKYRVIPRKTVKIVRRGSSSIGKVNYLDTSRYTNKNKRGSFTITIKSGQNFFN